MSLKSSIENDLKAALLSGNRFKVQVLRSLKAVILDEEVAQGKREEGLDDSTIENLIAREIKKRKESAEAYKQAGRQELVDSEFQEAEAMTEYLPQQLSETEISDEVKKTIAELGAKDLKMMGAVIGATKQRLGNTADGSLIAKIVKEVLS